MPRFMLMRLPRKEVVGSAELPLLPGFLKRHGLAGSIMMAVSLSTTIIC